MPAHPDKRLIPPNRTHFPGARGVFAEHALYNDLLPLKQAGKGFFAWRDNIKIPGEQSGKFLDSPPRLYWVDSFHISEPITGGLYRSVMGQESLSAAQPNWEACRVTCHQADQFARLAEKSLQTRAPQIAVTLPTDAQNQAFLRGPAMTVDLVMNALKMNDPEEIFLLLKTRPSALPYFTDGPLHEGATVLMASETDKIRAAVKTHSPKEVYAWRGVGSFLAGAANRPRWHHDQWVWLRDRHESERPHDSRNPFQPPLTGTELRAMGGGNPLPFDSHDVSADEIGERMFDLPDKRRSDTGFRVVVENLP